MPSEYLEKLGKTILEKEQQLLDRRRTLGRLSNQFDAGAYRRYPSEAAYIRAETGKENYEGDTDQLEAEIKELRDEYDIEEAIELDREEQEKAQKEKKEKKKTERDRQQNLPGIESTSIEKVETKIPGFGEVVDAAAKVELLRKAAMSRAGKKAAAKGAAKLIGGMAAKQALGPYKLLLELLPAMEAYATRKKDDGA